MKHLLILAAFIMAVTTHHIRAQTLQRAVDDRLDSLHNILQRNNDPAIAINVLGELGWEYINNAQYNLARKYADSLSTVAKSEGDAPAMAQATFYRGVISRHTAEYDSAIQHLQSAIHKYAALGDSASIARALFHSGVVNVYLGKYEKGLSAFYRVMAIHEKDGSYKGVAYTLNGIGVIYRNMGKHADAERVLTRAIAIYDTIDAPEDQSISMYNLANVYMELGKTEDALKQYRRVLEIDKRLGKASSIAYDLASIGVAYNEMQMHDSALVYQLKALEIYEGLPEKFELATIRKQIGHTYLYLQRYTVAEQFLLKALTVAKGIKAITIERDIAQYLASVYAAQNQFAKAFEYQKRFAVLQDSIMNVESARQLNELKTKYETDKKDHEIALLANEKKLQEAEAERQATLKEAFIAGFVLIALLAVLVVYALRQRLRNQSAMSRKNEEVREANFKRQLMELERKALQAQINPHFLFNCMNSINRMILDGDNEHASHYLAKFSKLVRLILENAGNSTVSLRNELALVESYINLEQLRFKGRMDYKISVDSALDRDATRLPSMVLQPFVENAIWHGLMHKHNGEKGTIEIAVKEELGRLRCIVEDNGIGRERAGTLRDLSVLKTRSMGMQITEERLKLMGEGQLIEIVDLVSSDGQPCGTRVEINIPMTG